MDYCNNFYIELYAKTAFTQTGASAEVSRVSHNEYITPMLWDLHWLPVSIQVEFKVLVIA